MTHPNGNSCKLKEDTLLSLRGTVGNVWHEREDSMYYISDIVATATGQFYKKERTVNHQ